MPVVVRVLGIRWEAVDYGYAVGDAFQRVRPPAPLVRGDLVVKDGQIVRAYLFRLRTSTIDHRPSNKKVFPKRERQQQSSPRHKGEGSKMFDCASYDMYEGAISVHAVPFLTNELLKMFPEITNPVLATPLPYFRY